MSRSVQQDNSQAQTLERERVEWFGKLQVHQPVHMWSCACGWTNTTTDLSCQRCNHGQVDGYGFRI
jgi:hypothetical protein